MQCRRLLVVWGKPSCGGDLNEPLPRRSERSDRKLTGMRGLGDLALGRHLLERVDPVRDRQSRAAPKAPEAEARWTETNRFPCGSRVY